MDRRSRVCDPDRRERDREDDAGHGPRRVRLPARTARRFTTLAGLATELQEADQADSRRELARVVGRYSRIEVLLLDLCRYRDYADIAVAAGLNALRCLGFSAMTPASLSA